MNEEEEENKKNKHKTKKKDKKDKKNEKTQQITQTNNQINSLTQISPNSSSNSLNEKLKTSRKKTMILSEDNIVKYAGTSCAGVEYETIDVLYRKAFNSLSLVDIFIYFEALVKDQSDLKLAKLKEGFYFVFIFYFFLILLLYLRFIMKIII